MVIYPLCLLSSRKRCKTALRMLQIEEYLAACVVRPAYRAAHGSIANTLKQSSLGSYDARMLFCSSVNPAKKK